MKIKDLFNKIDKSKQVEEFKDSTEFRTIQLFMIRFEHVGWYLAKIVSDKVEQSRIALILSTMLSTLYLIDSSNLSSISQTVRFVILSMSLLMTLVSFKLSLANSVMGYDAVKRIVSVMQTCSVLSILTSLVLAPMIYTSIFARCLEIVCLVFLLASFINKSSDMYEN